ncbi:DnaD domain protein [Halobacillus salinarum]|uniref:DnaD domain protein n=1 Tax=Halobacillus salinarum TaxID=2932257 RepID=A0ABY4EPT7_9BACI|nr:DnaD domain protein [Halobacillus salinarum]UOQ46183.1 DnaD domain protein [Halobacillus salinarum]
MEYAIGKLLPIDGYRLKKSGVSHNRERVALTHLYQPLLGQLAISLFQFLDSEFETMDEQEVHTHHTIMSYLSVQLDKIYEARKKLEAIGLLRSYKCIEDGHTVYLYEIVSPFTPEEFFLDEMLSLLLHHELGEDKYLALKKRVSHKSYDLSKYEETTAAFEDVFQPISQSASRLKKNVESKPNEYGLAKGPVVTDSRVDFHWLKETLRERMYPSDRILTGNNKRVIVQLAYLYNLTSTEIEKAVTWAINEDNEFMVEEFKAACHDFINARPSTSASPLESQREKLSSKEQQTGTKEEQFVAMLEQISPKELLEDLSSGSHAADQDLKIIRDVMTEQGLAPGVMNVLVHYVMLKTDMKLSKPYLEKIASHWARKNVSTVRQAMNMAKAEHQQYQQWGKQKKTYRQNGKKEVLPSWFKEQKNKSSTNEAASSYNSSEMAERIRRLTNKGNGS